MRLKLIALLFILSTGIIGCTKNEEPIPTPVRTILVYLIANNSLDSYSYTDIEEMIAGVTEPNNKYTHLYYGYTSKNRELMYSNSRELLEEFCSEVIEMDNNTYMKNGVFYTLEGEKISKNSNEIF